MTSQEHEQLQRTPKHLWIFGGLNLLWHAWLLYDLIMLLVRNEEYLATSPSELLALFYDGPRWLQVLWAVAVARGVLGSAMLVMRKANAVRSLVVFFGGSLVCSIYNFSALLDFAGPVGPMLSALELLVALGFVFYASDMRKRGVLR